MQAALKSTISAFDEMLAYETLWAMLNSSLKKIAEMFCEHKVLPSELLKIKSDMFDVPKLKEEVEKFLLNKRGFLVSINGDFQYPKRLRAARYPIELFYYKGDVGLLDSPCISVVGARKCTEKGIKRTMDLVKGLVKNDYTIVSGLASGIDKVAMETAIASKGNTIGVIGTPIDEYYPKENKLLQDEISSKYLLMSQVPFYRYKKEPFSSKRNYFPQRNATMSALSYATIIVEASDTSGTLIQARECLAQNRKLFILNSCFENSNISWPRKYEERGAKRVYELDDILNVLNNGPTKK
tara:strand:+ start:5027 stop:5917 length:891 start_codon:yes stop_codon:yes gene_type:complete